MGKAGKFWWLVKQNDDADEDDVELNVGAELVTEFDGEAGAISDLPAMSLNLRLLWSSLRLWKFGKLAFGLYIKAVIFAWCQSAFCCWRMGSRAGSKLKPMFSSLIWGLNSIFWESTAKMHNVESSNRTHSFCIIYKNHQTSTFHITLSLNWFDRGILLTLKAVAISCVAKSRTRSTFRTGCQAPRCEGNWSRSSCKPLRIRWNPSSTLHNVNMMLVWC